MNYSKDKNDNAKSPAVGILIPEEAADITTPFDEVLESDAPAISSGAVFTQNTGVVGVVTDGIGNPIDGLLVRLYAGSTANGNIVGTATTDIDGSYSIPYRHNGEEECFSLRVIPPLPSGAKTVTPDPAVIALKSRGFAFAHFVID